MEPLVRVDAVAGEVVEPVQPVEPLARVFVLPLEQEALAAGVGVQYFDVLAMQVAAGFAVWSAVSVGGVEGHHHRRPARLARIARVALAGGPATVFAVPDVLG